MRTLGFQLNLDVQSMPQLQHHTASPSNDPITSTDAAVIASHCEDVAFALQHLQNGSCFSGVFPVSIPRLPTL